MIAVSDIKLFGKWDFDNIEIRDIGLQRYINLRPVYIPHTGGRHEHKRFGKANVPIVERLLNKLMNPGLAKGKGGKHIKMSDASGKKERAIKIVKAAFELIYLKTGKNPIQILVRAIENAAPREETTRISYGGIVYHQAVDIAPLRRIDIALRYLVQGSLKASIGNAKTIEECLADELIAAAENNPRSYAISKKEEKERIALSTR
ncbi:MAG: 30S ribosomal protein S7 [Candidatus Odinarchaeia archaeon]